MVLEDERLPRFMNRGLIEADRPFRRRPKVRTLPRFMNRGLIEAAIRTSSANSAQATSPIHESGPH